VQKFHINSFINSYFYSDKPFGCVLTYKVYVNCIVTNYITSSSALSSDYLAELFFNVLSYDVMNE